MNGHNSHGGIRPCRNSMGGALIAALLLVALSTIMGQVIFSTLRLSQFFYRIGQKNLEFIIPLSEFFNHPFALTWGNLKSLIRWEVGYLTLPIVLLIILAFTHLKWFKQKLGLKTNII